MIISLVNPHDVLAYPRNFTAGGYSEEWLGGGIGLPATVDEDLSDKPRAQEAFRKIFDLSGKLRTPQQKRNYLNFYGNLMKASDDYLVNVLAALDSVTTSSGTTLYDDTLVIRTADHGEMGLAHGGLRQKNFNFYEEAIRVPLVYSNPQLFKKPRRSSALVSHVDFLPTLASLFAAPQSARSAWQGRDYSRLVRRSSAAPVQDYIVFTYDDFQAGQADGPYVPPPQHIVSIRETRWKLAQYYDPDGGGPARVGDVRPEDRPPRDHQPRPARLPAHARRERAVRACAGGSRRCGRPACSRSRWPPSQAAPGPRGRRRRRDRRRGGARSVRGRAHRGGEAPTAVGVHLTGRTALAKVQSSTVLIDRGTVTGSPVGSGRITLVYTLHPGPGHRVHEVHDRERARHRHGPGHLALRRHPPAPHLHRRRARSRAAPAPTPASAALRWRSTRSTRSPARGRPWPSRAAPRSRSRAARS